MKRYACVLLLLISSAFAQETYDQLRRHWDYDKSAPLDIKEAGVQDREGVKVHDLSYASPAGDRAKTLGSAAGRVPAYLVVPQGKGPFPAMIYAHWCMPGSEMRNRKEFLDEALVLARSGVISLLTDHVEVRSGFVRDQSPLNVQQIDVLVQQVVDLRRGADLLLARKDVDPRRLGYAGHSCGGESGAVLSGIDKRFRTFVILAGGASDDLMLATPFYKQYRQKIGPDKFDAFAAQYSWTDPGKYISHAAPAFVFLQYATDEPVVKPEMAKQYFAMVSEPRKFKLYDAPHALTPEATRDRIAFLADQLSFKPPDPQAVAAIPALFQPPWPNPLDQPKPKKESDKK